MKSIIELQRERKSGLGYWVESAKQDFMIEINEKMKSQGISKAQLAESISCSQAYISKVMKGDANFTIETMVKIAKALNSKLCIQLAQSHEDIQWLGIVTPARKHVQEEKSQWASPATRKLTARIAAHG